jgi:hypothetical protein
MKEPSAISFAAVTQAFSRSEVYRGERGAFRSFDCEWKALLRRARPLRASTAFYTAPSPNRSERSRDRCQSRHGLPQIANGRDAAIAAGADRQARAATV